MLRLPIKKSNEKDLSSEAVSTLQLKLNNIKYILIDEYSMLSQKNLYWIDRRLKQISNLHNIKFGGFNIILVGDLWQLPPVNARTLYDSFSNTVEENNAYSLFLSFNKVHILKTIMRQRDVDNDNLKFKDVLNNLRIGKIEEGDWEFLKKRFVLNGLV